MGVGVLSGNIQGVTLLTATVDLGSVAANTTEEETATVSGVKLGDFVLVSKSKLSAGILLGTCRVTAADTVAIQVVNTTGSAVNASSETMTFVVIRPEQSVEKVLS